MHPTPYPLLILLALGQTACTVSNPDYELAELRPDGSIGERQELSPVHADVCPPGAFLRCQGDALLRCAPGGGVEVLRCLHGCSAEATSCNVCDPQVPLRCAGDDLVLCSPGGQESRHRCTAGCQDDHCLGCSLATYHRDRDGDGFGDPTAAVTACDQPIGYVEPAGDCDDDDVDVHPGQRGFFSTPSAGKQTFDYDCDGQLELEQPALVSCQLGAQGCEGDGWAMQVPSCGGAELLITCVAYAFLGCGPWPYWQVQRCR